MVSGGKIGVGFDIDHTLVVDNKLERVAFLRLLEPIVAEGGAVGSIYDETAAIDELLAFSRGGGCTIDEAVLRFARERGVSGDGFVQRFEDFAIAMAPHFVVADPQAPTVLSMLADRGITTCVLSNGWNPLQTLKARIAGFGGAVLASADLGVQKPHRNAFEALCRALDLPPEHCWYVGDDPRNDIVGALAAGLNAVWLDHEGKSYPQDAPVPTRTIHALSELSALFDLEAV